MIISKKQRRRIRSHYFKDMKPHIFDKLLDSIPYVLKGYGNIDKYLV
jgi:hypothetical protein